MASLTLDVLCEETFDRQVIAYIESEGHRGEHVVDVLGPGAGDATDIAPYARSKDLLVLTKDTDFLEMDEDDHAGPLPRRSPPFGVRDRIGTHHDRRCVP